MNLNTQFRKLLTVGNASNTLYDLFGPLPRKLTVGQFIKQYPIARLQKEFPRFGGWTRLELLQIMDPHVSCKTGIRYAEYVQTLKPMINDPINRHAKLKSSDRTIATLRRQKTCLERRLTKLRRHAAVLRDGMHVIRWAKQAVDSPTGQYWAMIQLKRAVKNFSKHHPKP